MITYDAYRSREKLLKVLESIFLSAFVKFRIRIEITLTKLTADTEKSSLT